MSYDDFIADVAKVVEGVGGAIIVLGGLAAAPRGGEKG